MDFSRRSFLSAVAAAVPLAACGAPVNVALRAAIGTLRWGQTDARWLESVVAALGLGMPCTITALCGAEHGAWCATLRFEDTGTLMVTSGIANIGMDTVVLRGSAGECRVAGHSLSSTGNAAMAAALFSGIETAKASGKPVRLASIQSNRPA